MTESRMIQTLRYYLSEHPSIVGFRWTDSQSWGNTWVFLFISISSYIILSVFLHLFLLLVFRHRRPLPLGPIPAVHSLSMALISFTIFAGILLSAAAEIRDTRWFWRRYKTTPFQWLLCFPIGTRPSGRILDCCWITQGGCNGIGAWVLNSVLNGAILFFFLNYYVKLHLEEKKKIRAAKQMLKDKDN
ncbi:hypothetical protein KY289_016353 [Solanum tuberosum]|nr:hypothetical protein KY289_016353 [Solanum tuberosum]